MSINFQTFIQKTGFSPPYAARKILYHPSSRPALLAETLELNVSGTERANMVLICAGRIKFKSDDAPVETAELNDAQVPSAEEGTPVSVGA